MSAPDKSRVSLLKLFIFFLFFLLQQVQLIVRNALKLYSQDRTGLVDYALESAGKCHGALLCKSSELKRREICGVSRLFVSVCVCAGGSILSTRCSETYETKTALMSLFGVPLWYFSQSPRVVIQVNQNKSP